MIFVLFLFVFICFSSDRFLDCTFRFIRKPKRESLHKIHSDAEIKKENDGGFYYFLYFLDPLLKQWLDKHGFGKYNSLFQKESFNLEAFLSVTEKDLAELKLKLGTRKQILAAIQSESF